MERELIILSLVRSNAGGVLGFVSDPRRMNVALTRAKRGLIVVGDGRTLTQSGDPLWDKWVKWVAENEAILHCQDLYSKF